MVLLSDLLDGDSTGRLNIVPGTVLLGEMKGVDHLKFFVVAGVSNDRICVCSVVINSAINPFIMRRPHLLSRQVQILNERYSFLSHDSYVNCAQPLKGTADFFNGFKRVGQLTDEDLNLVRKEVVLSGTLTKNELKTYNLHSSQQ
ncbi:MAG: hypothetical protein ACI4B3_01065 [Prevotella sp.]